MNTFLKLYLITLTIFIMLISGCKNRNDRTPDRTSENKNPTTPLNKKINLLIITADTTRADHLACYGYKKIKTPNIDLLAKDGVLFKEAFSVQPVTLPAHSSIMTGLYPYHTGVRDNNIYKLPDKIDTIAEILSKRGYLTTAFIASFILNRRFGLDQGFKYYNDKFVKPQQEGRLPIERTAKEVSYLAVKWFDTVKESLTKQPFFLWLHYYDPHAVYKPAVPFKDAYQNPYDGEIAYMDDWIGYVIDKLKKENLYNNTIIVFAGDHGESLGEHKEKTHGMFIYRSTTHIPLIIKFPENLYNGKVVDLRVSQTDIADTIFDILNIKNTLPIDGKTTIPLIKGLEKEDRTVYSEAFIPRTFNWSELKGVRHENYFYIDAPKSELYNINGGAIEKENIIEKEPQVAAELKIVIDKQLETEDKNSHKIAIDQQTEEQLKALGYFIGSGDNNTSKKHLKDPKDMIELFNAQQRAASHMDNGDYEAALEEYLQLTEQDPQNPRFLLDLADIYKQLHMDDKALETVLDVLIFDPENLSALLMAGSLYKKTGQLKGAEKIYTQLLLTDKNNYMALFSLSVINIKNRQWNAAKEYLEKALKIEKNPDLYNNLGLVEIKGFNNYEAGIEYIKMAVKLAKNKKPYQKSLNDALKHH